MEYNHQIVCEKRSYSKEFISHEHEFGQFLFPLRGSLDIQTKRQELHLTPNDCFYLPPKCNHHYRSRDRNEFLILDIPTMHLPEATNTMHIQLDQQWEAIRYLLLEEATKVDKTASLTNLTKYVTSKLQTTKPPSIDYIHKHNKKTNSLEKIAKNEHYHTNNKKPIRIKTLEKMEHYHPVNYSTWFKERTGKSPINYIAELRLKEAKQLLTSTSWPITKISEEIGFENASSFTRWFVKWAS